MVLKLTMVGAEHSYFSGKVRSYLKYKGEQDVFFNEVLPTADVYVNAILPLVGVNFIPILIVCDENNKIIEAIQDTSLIIDYVESKYPELPSIHPVTPVQNFVSYLFELWSDEWLKFPAMHYRWSYLNENEKYLLYEWGRVSFPTLPSKERDQIVLGLKLKGPSFSTMKSSLPFLGITSKTVPEIEKSFINLLELLDEHFRKYKFLLGDRPCLGDFALMGPFYAHLYRDPKPSQIVRSHAPAFCEYIERMYGLRPAYETFPDLENKTISYPKSMAKFGKVFSHGEFLPNDEIPSSLLPVIEMIFKEHIPILISTSTELKEYFQTRPPNELKIPRTIGFHDFKFGNSEKEQRLTFPYDLWMLQRCMDSIKDTKLVHQFIKKFPNGNELLNLDLSSSRVELVNFKLQRANQSKL